MLVLIKKIGGISMKNFKVAITNDKNEVIMEKQIQERGYLFYDKAYNEGDKITLTLDQAGQFVKVKIDDAMAETILFIKGTTWTFEIPSEKNIKVSYPSYAFAGENHYLSFSIPSEDEVYAYRNLTLNPLDQNKKEEAFPHASANVETRNEATFFARNAIDGVLANEDHGFWPYQSWGINRQADAALRVLFGKEVEVDRVGIALRADFPHDSYWTQATLEFSDGSREVISLEKDKDLQFFDFEKRTIEWIEIKELIKAEDESPFPALTQLEVYGRYLK